MRRIPHDVKKISQRMMPVSDATPEDDATAAALKRHVAAIAQAPRNLWHYDSLQRAATYIDGEFTQSGYDARHQAYEVMGQHVMNIEAERRGSRRPDRILVIGAHYDSIADSPGANDNGYLPYGGLWLPDSWLPNSSRI